MLHCKSYCLWQILQLFRFPLIFSYPKNIPTTSLIPPVISSTDSLVILWNRRQLTRLYCLTPPPPILSFPFIALTWVFIYLCSSSPLLVSRFSVIALFSILLWTSFFFPLCDCLHVPNHVKSKLKASNSQKLSVFRLIFLRSYDLKVMEGKTQHVRITTFFFFYCAFRN